jgi:hypothetical protein
MSLPDYSATVDDNSHLKSYAIYAMHVPSDFVVVFAIRPELLLVESKRVQRHRKI